MAPSKISKFIGISNLSDNEESHDVVEDLVSPMDHSSLNSPHESPDTTSNTRRNVLIDIDQYKAESARLQTFQYWPSSHIRPADLANAGFIYAGNDDLVRCVFCGQYVGNWEEDDFPMTEHRSLFPDCPFIQGRDVGNIPIIHGVDAAMPLVQPSEDETGIRPRPGRQAFSVPEKGNYSRIICSSVRSKTRQNITRCN